MSPLESGVLDNTTGRSQNLLYSLRVFTIMGRVQMRALTLTSAILDLENLSWFNTSCNRVFIRWVKASRRGLSLSIIKWMMNHELSINFNLLPVINGSGLLARHFHSSPRKEARSWKNTIQSLCGRQSGWRQTRIRNHKNRNLSERRYILLLDTTFTRS